jgi:hypothetical protein
MMCVFGMWLQITHMHKRRTQAEAVNGQLHRYLQTNT